MVDYVAVGVYMLLMAGIGIFFGKFIHNIGDYIKGGSTIPWLAAGISNFMGLFSTFIFVAYAGIAYEFGLVAVTVLWCTVPASLVGALIFAKRWRRAGIMTPVEFLETRYNATTRQVFSWGGLGFRLLDNMVRLYALGIFVAAATPLNLRMAIIAAGLIILIYTVVGGLWAVVVTDVVQFVILILVTLILVPLSISSVGGWSNLTATIPDHFTWFNGPRGEWLFLLTYYIMIVVKYNGNWSFIQRFYSVRDEKAGLKSGLLTAGLFLIFPIVFILPSIAARVAVPDLPNHEMAYVAMSMLVLPEGVMGIMLAAMFAATMSALDSEYNVMAGVITRDIYQRLINPNATERQQIIVARTLTLLLGLAIIAGALFVGNFGGAFEANKLFTGLFAIPMVIPLLFGVILRKPRPAGAILTVIVGIATGLFLNGHPEISWASATLAEIVICTITLVISGKFESKRADYRLRVEEFFQRLQTPIPDEEKPAEDPGMRHALGFLYMIVFGLVGLLFMAVSLPSISELVGKLTFGVSMLCLLTAAIIFLILRSKKQAVFPEDGVDVKKEEVIV